VWLFLLHFSLSCTRFLWRAARDLIVSDVWATTDYSGLSQAAQDPACIPSALRGLNEVHGGLVLISRPVLTTMGLHSKQQIVSPTDFSCC
jgi:hypothetical protein